MVVFVCGLVGCISVTVTVIVSVSPKCQNVDAEGIVTVVGSVHDQLARVPNIALTIV